MTLTTMNGQTLRNHFSISPDQARNIEQEFSEWKSQFNCPAVITIVLHGDHFDVHINAVMKRDIAVGYYILGLVLLPYVKNYMNTKNQIPR